MKKETYLMPFSTVPSAPPTHIYIHEVTSFNVTVHWDPVNCIEQNGNITGYSVQYWVEESKTILIANVPMTEITISGFFCATNYYLKVAAVNSAGTGVYSNATLFTTEGRVLFWYLI